MEYPEWIERERRIRTRILLDWPEARDDGVFRICQSCGEICLCSEKTCPNCNVAEITKERIDLAELLSGSRIRCQYRFENLP